VISRLHPDFRRCIARLPEAVQRRARDAYRRFAADPSHPALQFIAQHTPDSQTRAKIVQARDLPSGYAVETVVSVLGNGSALTAPDTVPYCLWCAARSIGLFEEAMWTTVAGGGDMDTNCAIVGGILAAGELGAPPAEWVARREVLPLSCSDTNRPSSPYIIPIPNRKSQIGNRK
jgi:ADP-ribosylglycohydrolase